MRKSGGVSQNYQTDPVGATLFGQLKIGQLFFGQLNSASYFMEIRLEIDGLKI